MWRRPLARPTGIPMGEPGSRTGEQLTCVFRHGTVAAVRHEVHEFVRSAGMADPRLYKFVVAVSEVMANAVQHGGGRGQLRLWVDGAAVRCEVSDGGPGIPDGRIEGHQRPQPGVIGGWGLWLARQMSDRMHVDTSRLGTTVTLDIDLAV
jgi:serine/threonine-protein kinase RsbW